MPCALTQGLILDCRDSTGGLKIVKIAEFGAVSAITEASGIISAITKVTAKRFFAYTLVSQTGEAEESFVLNREAGTGFVKQTIKFPINKMTVAVRNELLILAQARLLISVEDTNGLPFLYGRENGLMLTTVSAKTGTKLGDRNGYELVFEGEERTLAPTITNAIYIALEAPGT